jgi:hypothetical protein
MTNKNLIQYQTINSYQIHLNSSSASIYNNSTYKSNCTFYIPSMIEYTQKTIELRISLVNAQIPCSFYQINSTNNKINITISGNTISYYFPYGNYNINTFITQWYSTIGGNWTLSLNSLTNQLIISNSANEFLLSDDDSNSLFSVIGFLKGNTYTSISKTLTSPYVVNFSGLKRLLITSPSFRLNSKTSYDSGETNVLASIPNNSTQNGIIHYNNITNFKSLLGNSEISNIHIEILDDTSNYINFNNQDWTLTLQIDNVCEVIQDLSTLDEVYYYESNNV